MECKVKETIHSLIGIRPIVNSILEKVVEPLTLLKYGKRSHNEVEAGLGDIISFGDTPPPKFIMLTGNIGCGKGAVVSAMVNELRKGSQRKSCDTYYSNRKVKFLGWDRTSWDVDSVEHLQNILKRAENSEDMTVLLFREFDSVCSNLPTNEPDDQHARRAVRQRRRNLANFLSELCRQLDRIQPGKILIIGSTTRPESVHKEALDRVEHTFHLPDPDEIQREELFRNFLEIENAALLSKNLSPSKFMQTLVTSTTLDFSAGDIQHIVEAAVANAKIRITNKEDWNEMPVPTPVEVEDFQRYIDLVLPETSQYFMPTKIIFDGDPASVRYAPPPEHPIMEAVGLVRRIPIIPEPERNANPNQIPEGLGNAHFWEQLEAGEIEEIDEDDHDYFDDGGFDDDNHLLDY